MGFRAVAVALVLMCGVASADDAKPWAVGVSAGKQKVALELFQAGNALFVKDEWRKALDLYIQAIAEWDHPNIRYNAAVCLIKLDRTVEAYQHMEAALRFGVAPLGKNLFDQGETYFQMLKNSVSHLEVRCGEPAGARVSLDGELVIARCPGSVTKIVKPGSHQVVSERTGYRTETVDVSAPAGGKQSHAVTMRLEGTRKLTRRWAWWKPWVVVGAGTAFSVAAVPLFIITRNRFEDYEVDLANLCSTGCGPNAALVEDSELPGDLKTARRYRAITITSIAVGAVGIGAGLALLVINQPRQSMRVTPMVGADGGGVSISADW